LLFLMAYARSAEELVLLRALQGLITGTLAAANALVAAETPRNQTGYAMGLLQVGLGAGVALGPLIGGAVADAFGYNAAFYITSAMLFLAGVLVWVGVEENFTPPEKPAGRRSGFATGWGGVLTTPGVMVAYSLRFLSGLGRMMIIPITPLFILTLLPDSERVNTFTGLVTGVAAGTATLSSVYLGRLGDRVGHRRILIASSLMTALLYLPQSLVTNGWQLLALQALVGVALGGIIPVISALLAQYTHAGEEGAVYGLDNAINAGARSVAPLLGSSVALWYGLRATFVATASLFCVGGLLAVWRLPAFKSRDLLESSDPLDAG